MSRLNSVFDIICGIPPHDNTSLEGNFPVHPDYANQTIGDGRIVKVVDNNGSPAVAPLTSSDEGAAPDYPWVVAVGSDYSDAGVSGKLTVYAVKPGIIFKTEIPQGVTFNVGDFVCADNGYIAKTEGKQYFGEIIEVNTVDNWVIVACGN
jgi:hypothetical protein